MSETTITVTTWNCDICGGETVSGNRPDGWADIVLWHNPGPDSRLMIGASCWKSMVNPAVEGKDPRKLEVAQ